MEFDTLKRGARRCTGDYQNVITGRFCLHAQYRLGKNLHEGKQTACVRLAIV